MEDYMENTTENTTETTVGELPYHRWPIFYGGWQAGSYIRCEGSNCEWCASRWTLVDPHTFEEIIVT